MAEVAILPSSALLEDHLDADVLRVRKELEILRQKYSNLRAAILSSTKIQSQIQGASTSTQRHDQNPLQENVSSDVKSQSNHNANNVYRLAFGVTSFPFTDPAPENEGLSPLLGVRFDVPSGRKGQFRESPYYVFLKKLNEGSSVLTVHHHSIPAHIDLEGLTKRFLPVPEADAMEVDGYGTQGHDDNSNSYNNASTKQDLHAFTSHLRTALVAFHLRLDTIELLAETLRLDSTTALSGKEKSRSNLGLYSVSSLISGDAAARQIRIVWNDGSVGRVKVGEDGEVVMAVVFGGKDNKRLMDVERTLTFGMVGDPVRAENLVDRLRLCEERGFWR